MKIKRICQVYDKRIAKENSVNRKKTKEGTLEHLEGRKNIITKNVDKYNKFSSL